MATETPDTVAVATERRAAPGAPAPRRLGLALAVIATAQLMVALDLTIVTVALPHIQAALHFSGSNLEWVVNAYAVAFGGLLLLGGRSGDLLGRRRVFIAGLLVFVLASLLGGLATGQAWLITARAVQGAGASLAAPSRGAAGRVRGDRDPQHRPAAAYPGAAQPGPVRRVPDQLVRRHRAARHVLLPHPVHPGRVGVQRAEDRRRLPAVRPGDAGRQPWPRSKG